MAMFDVGLADRLRAQNLRVVEIDGWRERGSESFAPRGYVAHHTGGAASGNAPSLRLVINGRGKPGQPGYLPGPLANVLQARDNTIYVVAAGRANHAGKGGWRGLSGNSSVWGNEVENVGTNTEPWREDQLEVTARVGYALMLGTPTFDADLACEHKEWSPGRKPDRHSVVGADLRNRIRVISDVPPVPSPSPEDYDMDFFIIRKAGNDGRWAWWPETHRKTIIAGDAITEFATNKHYGGDLKLEAAELDGIPNLAD